MGKTKRDRNKVKRDNIDTRPFISVCTPTFNRRPFIEYMIKCFNHQTYPKELMEWIIVDDGTDKIGDLVKHIPRVKYFEYPNKLTLGNKRNIMNDKSIGKIIVYMDDDDYYPPERVSHAVETLTNNPYAMCAGSSEMYIYFNHVKKMYQFGPYNANHATAGTFAFKRELLRITRFNDTASLAEEKDFLKNYTIPFVQLDSLKSILVFSHQHNTFDKRRLLEGDLSKNLVKESDKTLEMFIKHADFIDFYTNRVPLLLQDYAPGRPNMKPDVISQMVQLERSRKKDADVAASMASMASMSLADGGGSSNIAMLTPSGEYINMSMQQVANELQQSRVAINNLSRLDLANQLTISELRRELERYKKMNEKCISEHA